MTSFNAAFKKWFGRSRVVDENGEPLVVYHGTDADFTEFRLTNEIGYHFGTEEAANERIKQVWGYKHPGVVIMPCYLSLQNPLRVADQGTWESAEVALELWDKGVIGEEQFEVYKHELDQEDLVKLLAAKGYDGLCYYNLVEHKGGRRVSARGPRFKPVPDSWIALHPSQIKSVFNTGTWSREDPDIRRNPDEVDRLWQKENAKAARSDARKAGVLDRLLQIDPDSAVVRLAEALPEDIYYLKEKGREYNAGNVELFKMKPISCHANSSELYEEDPENTTIVTGYGLGPKDSLWREHTWVVRDGRVIETTTLRNAYFGYPLTRKQAAEFTEENW